MKFVTFVWVNSVVITCALLALNAREQELNLVCTNTDTQRSSIFDGQIISSQGGIDTFGIEINVNGTSSLILSYPAAESHDVSTFQMLETGEDFFLAQSDLGVKLSILNLSRYADQWWAKLIESEYNSGNTFAAVIKVYYCGAFNNI